MALKYLGGSGFAFNVPNRDIDDAESLELAKSLGYKRRDTFERWVASHGLHERVTSSSDEPEDSDDEPAGGAPAIDESTSDESAASAEGD